ncbi:O-linked N-acetylglucosamine transferase, SPINDLY family protein [Ideonella alba]|uniref:Acetylglucosamine transferase n=1 Tax=Ideonella alba TaxID=2824118 RepID=A0A940YA80_9BURK|nr:acetylglucosamine transferase [Ideonella alba]MBQ0932844.1 acetylglucosamine transferase [Ideonella alba]
MPATTLADPVAAPVASTAEADLARLRSGACPLAELLDRTAAWQARGDDDTAIHLYAEWLAHTDSPFRHVALFNQGTLLAARQRDPEAEAAYREALALLPAFSQARLNLGHALERRGDTDGALAEWARVVADTRPLPDDPRPEQRELCLHALNNLARLNEQLRRFDVAEAHMVDSLTIKPDQFDVIQHYVHIRQKQCEWPLYRTVGEVTPNQLLLGTSALAMLSVSDDPARQLMAALRFVQEKLPRTNHPPLHTSGPRREGRIRIGYLSGDLAMHAVGLLTAELFELHDRSRFETFAFCWSREDGSPLRERLLKSFEHVYRIGQMDDTLAARLIAGLGIDVLIDLQGLTNGARPAILALRPAPVQVSYLGFPGTCAIPGVDWIVADRFVMPEALLPFHTERPIYLPVCYQVSDRQRPVGAVPTRAQYGLPEDGFVYCSFNNNFKFTDEVFDSWMRTLAAVPGSVLWLLADNDWTRANLLARAAQHGIAEQRLVFAPRVAPPDYLARFALADLMLDTFPYNAGTTASDALWMGLPIVTLAGRSYISRMAGSLLTAVGLPELITETLPDYERLAVAIGRSPGRARSYRRYLEREGRQSPLFDMPARVREFEDALATLALKARQPE